MKRDSDAERATVRQNGGTIDMGAPEPRPLDADWLLGPLKALDTPEARYHVVERIGLGGMGEISATYDAKIGREIALKTLISHDPRELPVLQTRFVREAKVQALLEHPAIVPVYDIGIGPDDRPYFTMKRIRGETLFSVIEELREGQRATLKRVGRHRLLAAFVTICLAMEFAHQRGVVHRDLKPENIMLGPHGEVYILDWGLARIVAPQGSHPAPQVDDLDSGTRPGEMVGTPGFMPPEQVIGQHDEVDARSDVYALGAILYEILTLRGLHEGGDITAVIESTLNPTRTPPPAPDVAPELLAIAARATRFHKDQRFRSARALADAVELYLDGDRDQELRTKLASERLSAAKRELSTAVLGAEEEREAARAAALRHAGSALVLAPDSQEAAGVVLELLSRPPTETPEEVVSELDALELSHTKTAMRDNAMRITSWFLVVPVGIVMGLVRPWYAAMIVALMGLISIMSLTMWRRAMAGSRPRLALYVATTVLFALMSGLFGPFLVIPALAAVNTVLFSAQATSRERSLYIALGLTPFLIPMVLEMVGLIPPSFEFVAGTIVLHPRVLEFPPTVTFLFLATISSFGIATPTLLTGRIRDALQRAERELVLQKWQLGQLAPARPRVR